MTYVVYMMMSKGSCTFSLGGFSTTIVYIKVTSMTINHVTSSQVLALFQDRLGYLYFNDKVAESYSLYFHILTFQISFNVITYKEIKFILLYNNCKCIVQIV